MADKPKVLIIGDSISMGYTPHVAEMLAAEAEVVHNPGNGGDSENVLANLDAWLAGAAADVIHFNCGLHDIKFHRDPPHVQVPLERYRQNLQRIVERLRRTGSALIWATTTPVIESRHTAAKEFDRYNRDIDACNAAAAGVMAPANIATDDLHAAVTVSGLKAVICHDGVHLTEAGYRTLAQTVARCVGDLL